MLPNLRRHLSHLTFNLQRHQSPASRSTLLTRHLLLHRRLASFRAAHRALFVELEFSLLRVFLQLLEFAQQLRPLLFLHDVTHAALGAAAAGMIVPGVHVEAVVVRQLLACLDVAQRVDPDATTDDVGVAVRITGVVDVARRVAPLGTVDVITLVQREDIDGGTAGLFGLFHQRIATACGLGLGDFFTHILNDWRVVGNVATGEDAAIMNGRGADGPIAWGEGLRHV